MGDQGDDRLAAFRANLQAARKAEGLTQAELAVAMQELGHGFQQQTVAKIENGTRTVSVIEASDLSDILRASLEELLAPPQLDYAIELQGKLELAQFALRDAVGVFLEAQNRFVHYLDLTDLDHFSDDNLDSLLESPHGVVDFAMVRHEYNAKSTLQWVEHLAERFPDQQRYADAAAMLRENGDARIVGPMMAALEARRHGGDDGVDPEA